MSESNRDFLNENEGDGQEAQEPMNGDNAASERGEEPVTGREEMDQRDSLEETSQPPADRVIERLKAEAEKYKDLALRSAADLDNYRKRMAREKEEAVKYANSGMLERLIPVIDNFELGLEAARSGENAPAILSGMTMVHKQLIDFLAGCGVETIEAQGQPFDPNLHEAIAQEENAEVKEGFVVRQLRKGYKLRDRLIRPAHVVVSRGVPVTEPAGQTGK